MREKYREISEFLVPDFEFVPSINNISGNLGRYSRGTGRNRTGNLMRVSGKLMAVNRECSYVLLTNLLTSCSDSFDRNGAKGSCSGFDPQRVAKDAL